MSARAIDPTKILDLTERMLHLRQVPVTTMLPAPVLRMLASAMRHRTLSPGKQVLTKGTPMEAMYLLTEGALTLTRDGAPFGAIHAPQTVGFLPILARLDTPYDAVASVETRALELETDTILELFADHFELLAATLRYLAERLWLEFQDLPADALGMPPIDVGPVPNRPFDLVERILAFRKTSGFATANLNALAVLTRQTEEARIGPGVTLWEPGERADRVLFVVKGTIGCRTEDGRSFRYGSGTGVGGIEALADRPRWYRATTENDVAGFWGHTENLFDLFEHQLRMAMDFVAMLARAQLGLLERKAKLGQNPVAAVRDVAKLGAIRFGA